MEVAGWDRLRSLQFQASRIVCSNYRCSDGGSRADLAACLERFQGQDGSSSGPKFSGLCFTSAFPAKNGDLSPINETLLKHAGHSVVTSSPLPWKRDLLWTKEEAQVWFVHLDPFWADFYSCSPVKSKQPLPFIGTVPVTAWIHPSKGSMRV